MRTATSRFSWGACQDGYRLRDQSSRRTAVLLSSVTLKKVKEGEVTAGGTEQTGISGEAHALGFL